MFEAKPRMQHQTTDLLLNKDITRKLVQLFMIGIDFRFGVAVGVSAVELDVKSSGHRVSFEWMDGLIEVDSPHVIGRMEEVRLWRSAFEITVVDRMISPVIIEIDGALCLCVLVFERETGRPAHDVDRSVKHGTADRSRIFGLEADEVYVGRQLPFVV